MNYPPEMKALLDFDDDLAPPQKDFFTTRDLIEEGMF